MRCSVCQLDTDHARALRSGWGCDEDSPNEIDRIPCHCDGSPHCSRCDGLGRVSLRRCPNKVAGMLERSMVRYSSLATLGIWPAPGGALDQTQAFLDGYSVVMNEMSEIEDERMKSGR